MSIKCLNPDLNYLEFSECFSLSSWLIQLSKFQRNCLAGINSENSNLNESSAQYILDALNITFQHL